MKCSGCVARARAAIERLEGVDDVDVDLASGTALVRGAVAPQAVIDALADVGYPASPKTG